jgi:hypothetical protein
MNAQTNVYIEPTHNVEHTELMYAQTRNTYATLYDYITIHIVKTCTPNIPNIYNPYIIETSFWVVMTEKKKKSILHR